MELATLAQKVNSLSAVKLKKAVVKVPGIKAGKSKSSQKKPQGKQTTSSAIIMILIQKILEESKKKAKDSKQIAPLKYSLLKEEKDFQTGGYGSVSGFYGISPRKAYIDYGKLFSYLGKFKATSSSYTDAPTETLGSSTESKSFELVGREALDKGAKYVKYFFPKVADFHSNLTSLVPVAGMSSGEWEQFKLMMQLDPVMYALKSKTA